MLMFISSKIENGFLSFNLLLLKIYQRIFL